MGNITKTKNKLVSIITPCYNCAKYISQAIESALDQTYPYWEAIVVDDASADNSAEIVKEYCKKDNRIKLIRLEKNCGPSAARNRGIKEANGEYIAFLDADDLWKPEKLEKQVKFMENHPEHEMTHTNKMILYGNKISVSKVKISKELTFKDLFFGNLIFISSVMVKRSILDKVNYFDENIRMTEDWDLWLRIAYIGCNIGFLDEFLLIYRKHNTNTSNNSERMWEGTKQTLYKWQFLPLYKTALIANTLNHNAYIYMENFLDIFKNLKKNPTERKKLRFNEKIYNFFQNNNSFIIFGAGSFGEEVKYILDLNNKKVAYFLDNDINKKGSTIDNIEIKHPSQIKQFKHKIIIASTWREEIIKQLEKDYNLQYLVDYI